jgi:hypothetical protein
LSVAAFDTNAEALMERAHAHEALCNWSAASADVSLALSLSPDDPVAHRLRARVCSAMGMDRLAARELEAAIARGEQRGLTLLNEGRNHVREAPVALSRFVAARGLLQAQRSVVICENEMEKCRMGLELMRAAVVQKEGVLAVAMRPAPPIPPLPPLKSAK